MGCRICGSLFLRSTGKLSLWEIPCYNTPSNLKMVSEREIKDLSTYVIGDIHGALPQFQKMLKKIRFSPEKGDELYLLGDYIDWGEYPLETLLFVMHLDRSCERVHCLLGNHEEMFLSLIECGYRKGENNPIADNWLINNRGAGTWSEFSRLDRYHQWEVRKWLTQLPLSFDVRDGEKHYMLAHAYPYYYDQDHGGREERRRRSDAVWRRLLLREDPFAEYTGDQTYHCLICGHTITNYYFDRMKADKSWPLRKPRAAKRNRIFYGEKYVDIDCGAKLLSYTADTDPAIKKAAERAQLACLRLEDAEEFYVR